MSKKTFRLCIGAINSSSKNAKATKVLQNQKNTACGRYEISQANNNQSQPPRHNLCRATYVHTWVPQKKPIQGFGSPPPLLNLSKAMRREKFLATNHLSSFLSFPAFLRENSSKAAVRRAKMFHAPRTGGAHAQINQNHPTGSDARKKKSFRGVPRYDKVS